MRIFSINTYCRQQLAGFNNKKIYSNRMSNALNFKNTNYNTDVFFKGNKQPLYFIDCDGKYFKLSSLDEASKYFNKKQTCFYRVLDGQGLMDGYAGIRAIDIEKRDRSGNIVLDKTILENLRCYANRKAIYIIDADGNYTKFKSKQDAEKKIGISH